MRFGLSRALEKRKGRPIAMSGTETKNRRESWWQRLKGGLARTSQSLTGGITDLFTKRKLDAAALDELEDILIKADLGLDTAQRIVDAVRAGRYEREVSPEEVRV